MRRRTAHQYIKKNEKGGKEPPKTKLTSISEQWDIFQIDPLKF